MTDDVLITYTLPLRALDGAWAAFRGDDESFPELRLPTGRWVGLGRPGTIIIRPAPPSGAV